MVTFTMVSQTKAFAQNARITVKMQEATIDELIKKVRTETNYRFLYRVEEVNKFGKRNINVKDVTIEEFLQSILSNTQLTYEIENDVIIIRPVKAKESTLQKKRTIKGAVSDSKGETLPGATILLKGTSLGVVTDMDGKFKIEIADQDSIILVVSFVGMQTQEIHVKQAPKDDDKEIVIRLKPDVTEMDEVVITGYANVNKESFTGNTIAVKRDELLKVSKTNVIKALQAFDPSFRIQENNEWGSDPNTLPEMSIRGASGTGIKQLDPNYTTRGNLENNPNLPTFIMDGFEINVQKLYDFDPNRIESITILKDAAATALYGSRAANGVVVITTVTPKPGKINVSYNMTGSVVFPDLSDYNLLNAQEKLDLEELAGCYKDKNGDTTFEGEEEYYDKLANIKSGVDTYWLSKPLETVFNHKHSLFVEGGSENIRFGIDLSYNTNKGVMKGSFRDNTGAALYLDYRIGSLQIRNQVSYTITKSEESPYGDFSKYSRAQPYDSYKDENGEYTPTLKNYKNTADRDRENPLYESTLFNFDKSKTEEIINNLNANWYITPHLQAKATIGVTRTVTKGEKFLDPLSKRNSKPLSLTQLTSGELTQRSSDYFSWDMNAFISYNRSISKHNINVTMGTNIKETSSNNSSTQYRGFPSGALHSPNYAQEVYQKPSTNEGSSRLFSAFGTINYSYQNIYLFDLTGRIDGSSKFGADKKYAPFWSTGIGINIHNYPFTKNYAYISELKIRGSYGQTGNVNFSDYEAKTMYTLDDESWYQTGAGASLSAFGNKDLKWETTNVLDVGIEVSILDRLLYAKVSYYNKKTVDCINSVTIPSSTGFTTYKDNIGEVRNRGFEIEARGEIIRQKDVHMAIYANLSHNKNTLLKIAESLKAYNKKVDEHFSDINNQYNGTTNKPFTKYVEGVSMRSIWGVRSLGINPATGEEVFLNPDGSSSDTWQSSNQVVLGTTEPDAQGSFGLNLSYKNFSLFANFMYEFGGQRYNSTLVDRVENADIYSENVDKRVYTSRWQKPGDIAKYKKLESGRNGRPASTRPTSRFVQDYNMVSLNSISLGYDFSKEWLKRTGLSVVRFEIGAEDIARWSSVKEERGLSYPFARTINFSLRASF